MGALSRSVLTIVVLLSAWLARCEARPLAKASGIKVPAFFSVQNTAKMHAFKR